MLRLKEYECVVSANDCFFLHFQRLLHLPQSTGWPLKMTRIWKCALSQITPLKASLSARLSRTHLLSWGWQQLTTVRNSATCPPTGPGEMRCSVVPATTALESWRPRTLRVVMALQGLWAGLEGLWVLLVWAGLGCSSQCSTAVPQDRGMLPRWLCFLYPSSSVETRLRFSRLVQSEQKDLKNTLWGDRKLEIPLSNGTLKFY